MGNLYSTNETSHPVEGFLSAWLEDEREEKTIYADFVATPLGTMLAIVDDEKLHLLEFCDLKNLAYKIRKLQNNIGGRLHLDRNDVLAQLEAELEAYFTGTSAEFTIPCALHGSEFSRQVWQALQKIPVAVTCSYRQQAAAIGRPSAYRAVARANSQNKIAVIIPCHRVIGVNGQLTGYAGGLKRKEWLLAHERRYFMLN